MTTMWRSAQKRIAAATIMAAMIGALVPMGAAVAIDGPAVVYERTAYDVVGRIGEHRIHARHRWR